MGIENGTGAHNAVLLSLKEMKWTRAAMNELGRRYAKGKKRSQKVRSFLIPLTQGPLEDPKSQRQKVDEGWVLNGRRVSVWGGEKF